MFYLDFNKIIANWCKRGKFLLAVTFKYVLRRAIVDYFRTFVASLSDGIITLIDQNLACAEAIQVIDIPMPLTLKP